MRRGGESRTILGLPSASPAPWISIVASPTTTGSGSLFSCGKCSRRAGRCGRTDHCGNGRTATSRSCSSQQRPGIAFGSAQFTEPRWRLHQGRILRVRHDRRHGDRRGRRRPLHEGNSGHGRPLLSEPPCSPTAPFAFRGGRGCASGRWRRLLRRSRFLQALRNLLSRDCRLERRCKDETASPKVPTPRDYAVGELCGPGNGHASRLRLSRC